MNDLLQSLNESHGTEGDADTYFQLALSLEQSRDLHRAATAFDRAFGLAPDRVDIKAARKNLLDKLSVTEHGIEFRCIPGGTFLMGSEDGDPDEQPVHPVFLDAFWMASKPLDWKTFNEVCGFVAPPGIGFAESAESHSYETFKAISAGKAVWQARMSYSHAQEDSIYDAWEQKPMVSSNWFHGEVLEELLTTDQVRYKLPSEAQWEKAARGGLINQPYSWGEDYPNNKLADYMGIRGSQNKPQINPSEVMRPLHNLPANDYGIYGMCGDVWEWVQDWYDAQYYEDSPQVNPTGPEDGEQKVLRGGSWADDGEAITVSFRISLPPSLSRIPNIGFRLCRVVDDSSERT